MPSEAVVAAVMAESASRHRRNIRRSSRTRPLALVPNALGIRLCDGLVPCSERRTESRNDQMVRI